MKCHSNASVIAYKTEEVESTEVINNKTHKYHPLKTISKCKLWQVFSALPQLYFSPTSTLLEFYPDHENCEVARILGPSTCELNAELKTSTVSAKYLHNNE